MNYLQKTQEIKDSKYCYPFKNALNGKYGGRFFEENNRKIDL